MASVRDRQEKPTIHEFKLGKQIGEGNFSRLVTAEHIATGERFAIKVIEKQRVQRLRIRHPNIFNEINMEKDVLNRLRHPNVIRLFQTFQDEHCLYFLLELLTGGELLDQLMLDGKQVGLNEEAACFYAADIVNAMEYIHANKIVHRDLKPENLVIDARDGHLRLIDFGTAKNMADNSLNGPNFVGTPEYMSPETIDNKSVTYTSDFWALGCIIYQLLAGETPFSAGSAYLTFLKVQECSYDFPDFLSEEAKDLITRLLEKDPEKRLGAGPDGIEELKAHPFFQNVDFANHMRRAKPEVLGHDDHVVALVHKLMNFQEATKSKNYLSNLSDDLQNDIDVLSARDRSILMHLLKRRQVLHSSVIYPRFFSSMAEGRCRYAHKHGYIGFSHELQNEWAQGFSYMVIAGPRLGYAAAQVEQDDRGGSYWDEEKERFVEAVEMLNKPKPAFMVICGNFVNATPQQEFYLAQIREFQSILSHVRLTTRLVFVPGEIHPSKENLDAYHQHFGDDYYSFWFSGIKCIVINSTLLHDAKDDPFITKRLKKQEEWIQKELEHGKLCARNISIFSYDSVFPDSAESQQEQEQPVHVSPIEGRLADLYQARFLNEKTRVIVSCHPTRDSIERLRGNVCTNDQANDNEDADDESSRQPDTDLVLCKTPSQRSFQIVQVDSSSQTSIRVLRFRRKPACEVKVSGEATGSAASASNNNGTPDSVSTLQDSVSRLQVA